MAAKADSTLGVIVRDAEMIQLQQQYRALDEAAAKARDKARDQAENTFAKKITNWNTFNLKEAVEKYYSLKHPDCVEPKAQASSSEGSAASVCQSAGDSTTGQSLFLRNAAAQAARRKRLLDSHAAAATSSATAGGPTSGSAAKMP